MAKQKLSERQLFRMGILENIAIPIMLAPYVAINASESLHLVVLLVGVLSSFAYGMVMYFLQRKIPGGVYCMLEKDKGVVAGIAKLVYCLRFLLRAALIIVFFSMVIREYMLYSMNPWVVMAVFALVCLVGAAGDINRRGRLMELLYLWVVLPLILMAVFSLSSIRMGGSGKDEAAGQVEVFAGDEGDMPETVEAESHLAVEDAGIIKGGYLILLLVSGVELLFFSYGYADENARNCAIKICVWIGITVLLAYFIIVGILGTGWVASDSLAGFSVMESTKLPGNTVNRMDYLILSFWVVGVFAAVSGYLFCGRKMLDMLMGMNREVEKDEKNSRASYLLVFLIIIFFVLMLNMGDGGRLLYIYLIMADVLISLLLPVILILRNKRKMVKLSSLAALFILSASFLTGCGRQYESMSIENRDYVVDMKISAPGDDYEFSFSVADLTKYGSEGSNEDNEKEYIYYGDSIRSVIKKYYEDNEKQLDLGHISSLELKGERYEFDELILDLSKEAYISKSVQVVADGKKENLRDLIKDVYSRQ